MTPGLNGARSVHRLAPRAADGALAKNGAYFGAHPFWELAPPVATAAAAEEERERHRETGSNMVVNVTRET